MKRSVCLIICIALVICGWLSGCRPKIENKGLGLVKTPEMLFKSFRAAAPKASAGSSPELAADVDLSAYFPKPGDQGDIGSCTAWATAYACKSFHENLERNWGTEVQQHQFSPSYIYNQLCGGVDQGSAIELAVALVQEKGCATFATMPYTFNLSVSPSQAAHSEAVNYRAASFARVNFQDIAEVKRILSEGNAVIFGMMVYENFYNYTGGVYNTTSGAALGGHAMCVVGYDDGKQAFKVINSWSTWWGEQGYCWISYEIFTRDTMTAMVMYDEVVYHPEEAAVPLNIEASRGSYADKVEITWEKAKNAQSYRVYRSIKPDADFVRIASTLGTTYIDSAGNISTSADTSALAMKPGEKYFYAVRSIGVSGESDFSESAFGYAGSLEAEIGIPQKLEGLYADKAVYLSWEGVSGADGYYMYRFDKLKENYVRIGQSKDTNFRDVKEFTDREVLWYVVSAYRGEKEGAACKALVINVVFPEEIKPLPVPRNFRASQGEYTDRIRLDWDRVDGADVYVLAKWDESGKKWVKLAETGENFYEDREVASPQAFYTIVTRNARTASEVSDAVLGFVKEHEVPVIDKDIVYDDSEYYDDRKLEDTDYKDEKRYVDDKKTEKEVIYDRFDEDEKRENDARRKNEDKKAEDKKQDGKKDNNKDKTGEKEKDKSKEKKKDIATEDEALDKVREKLDQKQPSDTKKDSKTKERTKKLVEDESDDEEFFGNDDEFFGD